MDEETGDQKRQNSVGSEDDFFSTQRRRTTVSRGEAEKAVKQVETSNESLQKLIGKASDAVKEAQKGDLTPAARADVMKTLLAFCDKAMMEWAAAEQSLMAAGAL